MTPRMRVTFRLSSCPAGQWAAVGRAPIPGDKTHPGNGGGHPSKVTSVPPSLRGTDSALGREARSLVCPGTVRWLPRAAASDPDANGLRAGVPPSSKATRPSPAGPGLRTRPRLRPSSTHGVMMMAPAGDNQAGCDVTKTVLCVPTPVSCDLGRSPVTPRLDPTAQVFTRFASSSRMGPLSLSSF